MSKKFLLYYNADEEDFSKDINSMLEDGWDLRGDIQIKETLKRDIYGREQKYFMFYQVLIK